MPVTLELGEALSLIRLEGDITIGCAGELKKILLEGLASPGELQVDVQDASELDVTAVQLLWSAECEAHRSGKKFALAGASPEVVLLAMREAGFGEFPGAGDPK